MSMKNFRNFKKQKKLKAPRKTYKLGLEQGRKEVTDLFHAETIKNGGYVVTPGSDFMLDLDGLLLIRNKFSDSSMENIYLGYIPGYIIIRTDSLKF